MQTEEVINIELDSYIFLSGFVDTCFFVQLMNPIVKNLGHNCTSKTDAQNILDSQIVPTV